MTKERLYVYDTTLRDGQQTQGVQFSLAEKQQIAATLDALGVDYIEGGWPGANPIDSAWFDSQPKLRATFTAFGMTNAPDIRPKMTQRSMLWSMPIQRRSVWSVKPMIFMSKRRLASP